MSKVKLELTTEELSLIQYVLTTKLDAILNEIKTNGGITDDAMPAYINLKGLLSKIDAYYDIYTVINTASVTKSPVNETYSTQHTTVKPVDYECSLATEESQFKTNVMSQVHSNLQPVSNSDQTDNFVGNSEDTIQEKVFKIN